MYVGILLNAVVNRRKGRKKTTGICPFASSFIITDVWLQKNIKVFLAYSVISHTYPNSK